MSVFALPVKSMITPCKDVSAQESSKDSPEQQLHSVALNAQPNRLLARLTQHSASAQLVKSLILLDKDVSVMAVTRDNPRDQTQEATHSLAKNAQ